MPCLVLISRSTKRDNPGLTPGPEGATAAYDLAKKLADKNNWFYARQFENTANADIHEETTAIEILNDFKEIGLDFWVSGYGTGGTFSGVSRVLRKHSPQTKLIISEPENAQLINSMKAQNRNSDGSPAESHESWNPHPIQGWTPDFIPLVLQESIDNSYFDENFPVSGDDGVYWSNQLASKEGIMTGISGGSTFAVAMKIAEDAPDGSNILCMLADTAERYLTSPLFNLIDSEMNEDEEVILNSI